MSTPDVAGKVCWITGGANGFGAAAARRLAAMGGTVVVSDVEDDSGRAVAAAIDGDFVPCDVTSYDDVLTAVDTVTSRHGRLDVAFLNAGIATGCGLGADFDLAAYRRAMGVNLDGVAFGIQAAVAAMTASGGGDIVATASLAGLTAVPFDPIYAANKHAVVGLVRSLGTVYEPDGIRVHALCPSFAYTNIIKGSEQTLLDMGFPIIEVADVVDAFSRILDSASTGQCWYVVAGRPSEPFEFRRAPGPRLD